MKDLKTLVTLKSLREKALERLAVVERLLRDNKYLHHSDEYFECCGRVWSFKELGLISEEEAHQWLYKFAHLCELNYTGKEEK